MIRKQRNGTYVLAAFIYYFTPQELQTQMMSRPTEWLVLDFVSGLPKHKYLCSEREFSPAPHDETYSFALDKECDLSPEYYREAYNLLDEVRINYMKTGKMDLKHYKKYLTAILENTPESYHRFFVELGNVIAD